MVLLPLVVKLFFLGPDKLFEPHTIAMEWLRSGIFRYHHLGTWHHSYQFPVYPALLVMIYSVGGGVTGVLVFQVLCGTLSAVVTYRIARHLMAGTRGRDVVALASGFCTGASPFLAYYQVRMIHPFAWNMLLALIVLHGALTVRIKDRKGSIALFVIAGLALLDRPTMILFLLPFFWLNRNDLFVWKRSPFVALLALLLCLPISVWMVRAHALDGSWGLSSATGQNLWIGIQERTEGTAQASDGRNYIELLPPAELAHLLTLGPMEQSAYFTHKWSMACDADPTLWWRMMAVKLRNFWLFRSRPGMEHTSDRSALGVLVFKVYSSALLLLLFASLWLPGRPMMLVLFTSLAYSIVQSAFYVETRHRLLIEPILMMIALAVMFQLWCIIRERRRTGKVSRMQ